MSWVHSLQVLGVAVVASSLLQASSQAQSPQPEAQTAAPSNENNPAKPADNSNFFHELEKLLKAPAALLPSLKRAEPPSAPSLPAPAAPALDPVPSTPPAFDGPVKDPAPGSRLIPGIVSGRELCPRSENGSPDCNLGSEKLCRAKGYTGGRSLDTDALFDCSTKPLQTRGKLCGTETYVTRAFCH